MQQIGQVSFSSTTRGLILFVEGRLKKARLASGSCAFAATEQNKKRDDPVSLQFPRKRVILTIYSPWREDVGLCPPRPPTGEGRVETPIDVEGERPRLAVD